MSRKAQALAASLATLANSTLIGKGFATSVTAEHMLPTATALVRLDRVNERVDRQAARIAKRLEKNGKLIASLTGEPPDFSRPRPMPGHATDGVLNTIDQTLALWADTKGVPDVTNHTGE